MRTTQKHRLQIFKSTKPIQKKKNNKKKERKDHKDHLRSNLLSNKQTLNALIKRHSCRKRESLGDARPKRTIRNRCEFVGERKETADNRRGPPGSREKANPARTLAGFS